jgi:hypothetical protein
MRARILILLMILFPTGRILLAQDHELSSESTISLLTCGPGPEVYSYFGHSALRVKDPALNLDRVYNYGTFDFSVPNFYGQFIKGKCNYMLSVVRFKGFYPEYIMENRFIKERPLNITLEERQKLFNLLEINYLPENRHYWYDFFMDNCSTRIRDIVIKATDGKYIWPPEPESHLTYRQLVMPYISLSNWAKTGILLTLAGGSDREATQAGYMFLPDQMHRLFAGARLPNGEPLCKPEVVIFEPAYPKPKGTGLAHPYFVLSLLLLASWLINLYKKTPAAIVKGFRSLVLVISGGLGLVFSYMWFFSAFGVCHGNLNLAWAFPLNIILAVTIWIPKAKNINKIYSKTMILLLILFLLTFYLWKQKVPIEAILFSLTLLPGFYRLSGFNIFRQGKAQDQTN